MTMTHHALTIPSPCIGKCGLNRQDICKGCFRSLDEIRHWETMGEADRKATLANCQQRRQQRTAAQRGF